MNTQATKTARPRNALIGTLGTWLMIIATVSLGFVVLVETINTLFYDSYGDEYFLFRLAGVLENVAIGPLTYLMFGSLLVALMMGLPLAFVTGGLGVVFIYLVGDANMLNIMPGRIFPMMTNSDLAAIPLFIFMASMLERAGLIEEMFNVVYKWMGGLSGGLATATILASTILAAMVGVIGAAVVTMGIIALPAMLKRGYDHKIALGSIMAGGTLGILIPPSILAILYAVVAQQSVGELYLGAIIPGLMLSAMYILYVLIRTKLNPELGPPVPVEERISFKEKMLLLKDLIAPLVLVMLVLGLLFGGVATPVEAAGPRNALARVPQAAITTFASCAFRHSRAVSPNPLGLLRNSGNSPNSSSRAASVIAARPIWPGWKLSDATPSANTISWLSNRMWK